MTNNDQDTSSTTNTTRGELLKSCQKQAARRARSCRCRSPRDTGATPRPRSAAPLRTAGCRAWSPLRRGWTRPSRLRLVVSTLDLLRKTACWPLNSSVNAFWMGVNTCVPIAAPALPHAALKPSMWPRSAVGYTSPATRMVATPGPASAAARKMPYTMMNPAVLVWILPSAPPRMKPIRPWTRKPRAWVLRRPMRSRSSPPMRHPTGRKQLIMVPQPMFWMIVFSGLSWPTICDEKSPNGYAQKSYTGLGGAVSTYRTSMRMYR